MGSRLLLNVRCAAIIVAVLLLSACSRDQTPSPQTNQTTAPPPPTNWTYQTSFAGETWVVFKYADSIVTDTTVVSDTLFFTGDSTYTYNGAPQIYHAGGNHQTFQVHLKLNGTPLGNLRTGNGSGSPCPSFDTMGYVNSLYFLDDNSHFYYLWIHRL